MRRPNALITVAVVVDPAYAVQGQPAHRPVEFRYAGQRFRVARVLEMWLEAGRWWEQEAECVAWRVADARGGVYEIEMTRTEPPVWKLMVIYD